MKVENLYFHLFYVSSILVSGVYHTKLLEVFIDSVIYIFEVYLVFYLFTFIMEECAEPPICLLKCVFDCTVDIKHIAVLYALVIMVTCCIFPFFCMTSIFSSHADIRMH